MNEEFSSIAELKERVSPALNTRVREFIELGYNDIYEDDIWNFLVSSKWKVAVDLTLFDVVNDILNTEYSMILDYKNNNHNITD